jgi:hypothetical protein
MIPVHPFLISQLAEPVDGAAKADRECLVGGLAVVMNMPLSQATTHFSLCLPCQEQFIMRSGQTAMESQAPEVDRPMTSINIGDHAGSSE